MASVSQYAQYMRVDPQTIESIQAQGRARLEKLKPLSEFFDRNRFVPPRSVKEFTNRLNVNLIHFQANYMLFGLLLILYSLITNLWLLFDVVFVLFSVRFISQMSPNEPTSLFDGKVVLTQNQAWVVMACLATLILYFTAAGSAIFWIASVGVSVIVLHAGFMEKPIESDFGEGGEV